MSDTPLMSLTAEHRDDFEAFDYAEEFVTRLPGTRASAWFIVEGLSCAGCARKFERALNDVAGIDTVALNFTTRRAQLVWDSTRTRLTALMRAADGAGFKLIPYDPGRRQQSFDDERRYLLRRVLISGLLMMQVMACSLAIYFGEAWGMAGWTADMFRWLSLGMTLPVYVYCAQPFLAGALRDVSRRRVSMDVPIAVALTAALIASLYGCIARGEIYCDSIVMFTFLLLLARLLELGVRGRAAASIDALDDQRPVIASRRTEDGDPERVSARQLVPGDIVVVGNGALVPADGEILAGRGYVDESIITGESRPLPRGPGDPVIAGTTNSGDPFDMRVERVGDGSVLGRILELLHQAQSERTAGGELVNRVAGWFVAIVLVLAGVTGAAWYAAGNPQWFPIMLSILVVSCPCALALATPAAYTAAAARLIQSGVLVTRMQALEALATVHRFVFDKTGTLTTGRFALDAVAPAPGFSRDDCLAIAAALEAHVSHPVAAALRTKGRPVGIAEDVQVVRGRGVSGTIAGRRYWLGSPSFIAAQLREAGVTAPPPPTAEPGSTRVRLATADSLACDFILGDQLRDSAKNVAAELSAGGVSLSVLSGDELDVVRGVATGLGIESYAGGLTPDEKLAALGDLVAAGERVAMVGDGVNDGPVLARAEVGIAIGSGSAVARQAADVILLGEALAELPPLLHTARRMRNIIRQNISWAIGYNFVAIPLAIAGFIPPWAAAIGMSLSSLLVVGNATRLARKR